MFYFISFHYSIFIGLPRLTILYFRTGYKTPSLRKHPFLLALRLAKRPQRRRARRNGCFRRLQDSIQIPVRDSLRASFQGRPGSRAARGACSQVMSGKYVCWELCANSVLTYIVAYFYPFCFIICQVDGNVDCKIISS